MRKKILKISAITLLSAIFLFLGIAGCINIVRYSNIPDDDFSYLKGDANKVILFIGDGMGEAHIENAEMYLEKDLFINSIEKHGKVTTFSKNTYWPTDSAASATALATGEKVYNTRVAYENKKHIKTISELAKEQGLGVGIVTTDLLSGATPSAFSAHALKRSQTDQIIKTQLENKIDLYIGAGNETYSLYKTEWESKGYTFVQTYSELLNTKQEGKIIASFKSLGHTPSDDEATLSLVFEYAIEYFEKNFPNGYFLMVEGAHIDKMNHSNKVEEMIYYLNDFDKTINLAYDRFYNDPDFCMIITADHESGGLKLADSKAQITNDLYTTDGHTAKKVRYFIYQKGNDDINKIPNIIDNTSVFKINKNLLDL